MPEVCWYCANDYHEDCNGYANETLEVIIHCVCLHEQENRVNDLS